MEITWKQGRLPLIRTRRLMLRDIQINDITPEYERWLLDPMVTQFLEIRFTPQTRMLLEQYLKDKLCNYQTSKHFGIFDQDGKRLVGTVTAPKINLNHRSADVSYVIGHPAASGQHYATEAVHAMVYYLVYHCGVERLWAGYYDGHLASMKVLASNGFQVEGRLRYHYINAQGQRVDGILVGLLASEFIPQEKWLGFLTEHPPVGSSKVARV